MNNLIAFDRWLFELLNTAHNPLADAVMKLFSEKWFWIPLYLFFIYLLIRFFRKKIWISVLCVAVMITVTDQVSYRTKKGVGRPRPCNPAAQLDFPVQMVNEHFVTYEGECGGSGFFSGHATNSFAIATFMFFVLSSFGQRKYAWLLLAWAAIVAYSRVYLGVHYPLDILTGTVFGSLVGYSFYRIQKYFVLKVGML